MKRLLLILGATVAASGVAAAPAVAGLTDNLSFSHQIPVRAPSQAQTPLLLDDHGREGTAPATPSRSAHPEQGDDRSPATRGPEPRDDRGGTTRHAEPGDDRGGGTAEPSGERGGATAEPSDDQGGATRHAEPGDDHGRATANPEPGDDRGGNSGHGGGDG